MAQGSSSPRARIHRTIQTVAVTFPNGSQGSVTTDVTLPIAVTSPRYRITRQSPNPSTARVVVSFTLTTATNLRIIWERGTTLTPTDEQWLVEEYF